MHIDGKTLLLQTQQIDLLLSQIGVDILNYHQLLKILVVDGHPIQFLQRTVDEIHEVILLSLCLHIFLLTVDEGCLYLSCEFVDPLLRQKSQLGVDLLPKLNKPFELNPPYIFMIFLRCPK